jgi:peptidoglycan/xylan/chitin deacetylase (PgdA/CDA1 family)
MARSLKAAGHMIGAHTVTHPILSQLPPARQHDEIAESMDRIEAEIGERPRWLAYPVGTRGATSRISRRVVEDTGIELAFSNYGGHVSGGSFAPYDVRRIPAEAQRSPSILAATAALPYLFARPQRPGSRDVGRR